MIILDTHAWLWWTSNRPKLSRAATATLRHATEIGVSVISCWEVAMLVARRRLVLDRDPLSWATMTEQQGIQILPITPEIATSAALLPDTLHGDPADRLIVATALRHDAQLVTADRKIQDAALVSTLW